MPLGLVHVPLGRHLKAIRPGTPRGSVKFTLQQWPFGACTSALKCLNWHVTFVCWDSTNSGSSLHHSASDSECSWNMLWFCGTALGLKFCAFFWGCNGLLGACLLIVSRLSYFSTLKMVLVRSSEISWTSNRHWGVTFQKIIEPAKWPYTKATEFSLHLHNLFLYYLF